jgi:hypothetical protein
VTAAIHEAAITLHVEVEAWHQSESRPAAQKILLRKADGTFFDLSPLLVGVQPEAWDAIQAEIEDADADVLAGAAEDRRAAA